MISPADTEATRLKGLSSRQRLLFALIAIALLLSACATWQQPAEFDVSLLRERAETETVKGVRLSAAVLSTADSQRMFGANVNQTGVQPVWIEIENTTTQPLWLLRSGTDPDLFSPLEVAWSFHRTFAGGTNRKIDQHFDALGFQNPIPPGETRSGILYTNPHRKTRMLSIDVIGQSELFPFTLFPTVPDDVTHEATTLANINALIDAVTANYQDSERFRAQLEQLPCCATDADGAAAGDPFNVILVGHFEDIATAFVRRGYRMNVLQYDNAQWMYGRPPDVVARKTGQVGIPANWIRVWVAPLRYRGQTVLLAQAGRPLGWRLADSGNKPLRLNPKVDEVRNLFLQDMLYSSGVKQLAFVNGVGATRDEEFRGTLGGDRYQTDGLRAVLFISTRPQSLSDVELLDWHPYLDQRVDRTTQEHSLESDQ